MSAPVLGEEKVYDKARYGNSYNEIRVSTASVFGAAAHEFFLDNPLPAVNRMAEISNLTPQMPGSVASMTADPVIMPRSFTPISEEDFNRDYAQLGLKWDPQMSQETAAVLGARKQRELRNQDIMSRGKGGLGENVGKFGVALAVSLMDPVNVALSFIPVVGESRWARWAAKYGAGRARIAAGAVEGAAGAALTEPLTFAARTQEQADYTAMDSLFNILVGTALGSGLHAVSGAIGDIYLKRVRATEAHMKATDIAAKQLADGQVVDVSPIHRASEFDIMEADSAKDTRTSLDIHAMRAGVIPEHEVVKTGKVTEVRFKAETGRFKTLVGRGKNEAEAVRDLLVSYDYAFRGNEKAEYAATKLDQLKSELSQAVEERNKLRAIQQDPKAFEEKLRARGVPVDVLEGYKQRVEARAGERNLLEGKKMAKKLRLFDEETARMQEEYKALAELNVGTAFSDIDMETRAGIQQAEARIAELRAKMDDYIVEDVQSSLSKRTLIEEAPDDLPPVETIRNRESEELVPSAEKDLADVQEQIKNLTQDEGGDEAIKALDEDLKNAQTKAKLMDTAVNCIMGQL